MRLTAKTIHALRLPRGAADQVFFDGDLPGFGFRLRASGAKRGWCNTPSPARRGG